MRHNKWQAWRLASRRAAGLGGGEGLWQVMSKLLTETEIDCVRERQRVREWQTDTLSAAFCVVCPLLLKCFAVAYINQSGKTKRLPQAAAEAAAAARAAAGADTAWTDAKPEEPNYS